MKLFQLRTTRLSVSFVLLCCCYLIPTVAVAVSDDNQCKFDNSDEIETEWTQKLEKLKGKRFSVVTGDIKYHIGICTKATDVTDTGVGAISVKSEKISVLGKFSQATLSTRNPDTFLTLIYGGGESKESKECNITNGQAEIIIICDPKATDSSQALIRPSKQICSDAFVLRSPEICGGAIVTKGRSFFGTLFLTILIAILAYLVIGFLYKRFVLGAHGVEQIPNYLFWRKVGRIIQEAIGGSDRRAPAPDQYEHARQDDFQYDQPQLSVPASRPDDDHLLGSDQYQPRTQNLLGTKDDSDERLLPV